MRACDDCPGGTECAGTNLHPVLVQVFGLYAGGTTDKFDILAGLGDEAEALIEKYDHRVSSVCWSKAALLAIADVIGSSMPTDEGDTHVRATLNTARDAFERFPWKLEEIVEQAPDLHQAIQSECAEPFDGVLSKRAFVKICKDVAYRR